MSITAFDRNNLKTLRKDIDDALAAVATKHGIDLSIGTISFDQNKFTTRLTVTTKASAIAPEHGNSLFEGVAAQDIEAFKRYAPMVGLEESDLTKEFTDKGTRFAIVGYSPRSTKFPVLVKNLSNGAILKYTLRFVREAIGKQQPAQKISLTEFTKQVNDMARAECDAKNKRPGALFAAMHHDFMEVMLKSYYDDGMSPQETLQAIADEAEREGRAEARAS